MKKRNIVLVGLVVGFIFTDWLIHLNPKPAIAVYRLFSLGENAPFWLQRIEQRHEVRARVQSVGGWDALKSNCLVLLQTNQNRGFFWNKWQTNTPVLPSAIAKLQPMYVEVDSPNIVNISIYGMGESGHRGIANYGLEVNCGPPINPDEPRHFPSRTYRKIRDDIFENY